MSDETTEQRPIQAWIREATTRYLTDPDFHARVIIALALTRGTARVQGVTLAPEVEEGLIQAAVYGLLMADYDPSDNVTAEEAVKSMMATAEAMGMSLGARPMLEGEAPDA